MTEDEILIKAEKMLIGLQLINEFGPDVINSKMVSHETKYKLNNLVKQSEYFIEKLWSNFDDDEVDKEFNSKVKKVEDLLESLYLESSEKV